MIQPGPISLFVIPANAGTQQALSRCRRFQPTVYILASRENRLVTRGGGASATLRYDPLGRLYEVAGASGTRRFLYDGSDLVAEYNTSGTLLRRYVHGLGAGDDPQVWFEGSGVTDGARRYLYADERGSIVAVTDSTGAVLNVNTYDEYGIPGSGNAGAFQYTGQVWLPELGMYHYKARMYSPTLGRFMQTDPIGYGDGMNMYAYVGGDPVNGVDPTGLAAGIYDAGKGTYTCANGAVLSYGGQVGPDPCGGVSENDIVLTGNVPTPPTPFDWAAWQQGRQLADEYNRNSTSAAPGPDFWNQSASSDSSSASTSSSTAQKVEEKSAPAPTRRYDARVNYCGGEGGARFPNQHINEACYNHDVCYDGSGTPRSTCDLRFAGEIYLWRLLHNSSPVGAIDAATWSIIYGSAVALRGWQFYVPKN